MHVVVAKESDVTERIIHTGGEQIQGNHVRHATLETGGRESAKKRGGGVSWTAEALFVWIRTLDEHSRSGKCGYLAADLLRAALTCPIQAPPLRGSGLLAP